MKSDYPLYGLMPVANLMTPFLRDKMRIDEKRRRVVLRIIQGSNKYGLRTDGSQLDLSYTIRDWL